MLKSQYYNITDVQTSGYSNNVIISWSNGTVNVFDIKEKKVLCDVDVSYDSGGRRMAISNNGQCFAIASYDKAKVALFNSKNGNILWENNDNKKAQSICFSNKNDNVVVCFDGKPCTIYDKVSGKPIKYFKAVKGLFDNKNINSFLLNKTRKCEIVNANNDEVIGKIKYSSFALLDCLFEEAFIVLSEANGPISCYNPDCSLRWKIDKPNEHALILALIAENNEIIALDFNTLSGYGSIIKIRLDNGEIIDEINLQGIAIGNGCFNLSLKLLFASSGQVISMDHGRVIYDLNEYF